MEKKSVVNNSSGVTSVVFGILSIIFSLVSPILAIITGIVSLSFSMAQTKSIKNKWSKAGLILSIFGIVLSILIIALFATILKPYLEQLV